MGDFSEISKDVEEFDITVKDENELGSIRNASSAVAYLMREYFVETMSDILDKEKKVTHRGLRDEGREQAGL